MFQPDLRTVKTFEAVLEKTGKLVTADAKLRLRINPSGMGCLVAYLNKYIELGSALLCARATSTGEYLVLAKGMLYHEVAHWLFSPHDCAAWHAGFDWLEAIVSRCLEDCRIETWFAMSYKKSIDYFYLLNMAYIFPGFREAKDFSGEAEMFMLTYGRKFLPKQLLKQSLKFPWVTKKMRKLVDEYVKADYLLDRQLMRGNVKELAALLRQEHANQKQQGNLSNVKNKGADQGQDSQGAAKAAQKKAMGSKARSDVKQALDNGIDKQNEEVDKELEKEKKAKQEKKGKGQKGEQEESEESEEGEQGEGENGDVDNNKDTGNKKESKSGKGQNSQKDSEEEEESKEEEGEEEGESDNLEEEEEEEEEEESEGKSGSSGSMDYDDDEESDEEEEEDSEEGEGDGDGEEEGSWDDVEQEEEEEGDGSGFGEGEGNGEEGTESAEGESGTGESSEGLTADEDSLSAPEKTTGVGGGGQIDLSDLTEEIANRAADETLNEFKGQQKSYAREEEGEYNADNWSGSKGRMSDGEVSSKALRLTQFLKGMDSLEVREVRGKRRGNIDVARLHKVRHSTRIFKKSMRTYGDIVHIGILIDVSGSMGHLIPDVIDAAKILYKAGSMCKHKITIRAFGEGQQVVFQGFFNNRRWTNDNQGIKVGSGNTVIYEALKGFAADFADVKGKKILFIISDGHIATNFFEKDRYSRRRSGAQGIDYSEEREIWKACMAGVVKDLKAVGVDVQYLCVNDYEAQSQHLDRDADPGRLGAWLPATQPLNSSEARQNPNWFSDVVKEALKKARLK